MEAKSDVARGSGMPARSAVLVGGLTVLVLLMSCAKDPGLSNPNGLPVTDVGIGKRGPVTGIGLGGSDIAEMTNTMAKDILSSPRVTDTTGGRVPRIIIDSTYFRNEGSQPINKNLITQRLLVELNRAAGGRLVFVGRRHARMVEAEREIKRAGVVDGGTGPLPESPLGADLRLAGTFGTLDAGAADGRVQRYSQVVFELVNLESSELVWTNFYEVERAAVQDIVYR